MKKLIKTKKLILIYAANTINIIIDHFKIFSSFLIVIQNSPFNF